MMHPIDIKWYDEEGNQLKTPLGGMFSETPHKRVVYYKSDNGKITKEESYMVRPKNRDDNDYENDFHNFHNFHNSDSPVPDMLNIPPVPEKKITDLCINEIFCSISGEVGIIPQGRLVTVVRLQGCNLKCDYCDAENSQSIEDGYDMTIKEVSEIINKANLPVLITGGEPLLQHKALAVLLNKLSTHLIVQIETNGTISTETLKSNVGRINGFSVVMDYKFQSKPDSRILESLKQKDYLKFVVSSRTELMETMYMIGKLIYLKCKFAISSTDDRLYPAIIEAIKRTDQRVLVNVQIHKFIGVQ